MFDGWHEPIANFIHATDESGILKTARATSPLCAAGAVGWSRCSEMQRILARQISGRADAWRRWKTRWFWLSA
jgi:hypothetical protein